MSQNSDYSLTYLCILSRSSFITFLLNILRFVTCQHMGKSKDLRHSSPKKIIENGSVKYCTWTQNSKWEFCV